MTVLKQYDSGSSQWVPIVSGTTGATGPTGPIGATGPTGTVSLESPTFTGTPTLPTGTIATTQSPGNSTTAVATTAFVTAADNLKADLASPTFTGTPTLPTGTIATTQTAGNNTTAVATTAFVRTEVTNLIASAPAALDTLDELAAALGDDANFATTTATAIGLKAPLASPALTGTPTSPTAPAGTNTTQIATTAFVAQSIPVASLQMFAGTVTQTVSSGVVTTTAPSGWLLCNGNAVSRTTYSTLFASISTTYGAGDGTTTFNLPDMRSRMPIGVGTGTGLTARALAGAGGVETVILTSTQSGVPAHSHVNTLTNNTVTTGAGSLHSHGNTLTGTTTFASDGHTHGSGSLRAAIGATNSNANRIGYVAESVNGPGTATYSIESGGLLAGTAPFNHYTPVYGSTGGNSGSASVGISNAGEQAHTHSVTSNVTIGNVANTAADAASPHDNMSPYLGVNFIIKAV